MSDALLCPDCDTPVNKKPGQASLAGEDSEPIYECPAAGSHPDAGSLTARSEYLEHELKRPGQ